MPSQLTRSYASLSGFLAPFTSVSGAFGHIEVFTMALRLKERNLLLQNLYPITVNRANQRSLYQSRQVFTPLGHSRFPTDFQSQDHE